MYPSSTRMRNVILISGIYRIRQRGFMTRVWGGALSAVERRSP